MEYAASLATVVAGVTGIVVFVWGLFTFRRDARLHRAEHFGRLRQTLVSSPECSRLLHQIHEKDAELQRAAPLDKRTFICFFEEVAVLYRANLMQSELAYYMFGEPAIECADNEHFWSKDFPRDEEYWWLFFGFVRQMRKLHDRRRAGEWRLEKLKV